MVIVIVCVLVLGIPDRSESGRTAVTYRDT